MQKITRVAIIAIVSFSYLNSLVFIGLGIQKTIHAYIIIGQGRLADRPGVFIAEALDSFLIALFFIIFSIGVSKLFLPNTTLIKGHELPWLKIESFSALKFIIWEMLLTTLFVYSVVMIILDGGHLDWTTLIIPAAILILSVSYKFLKHGH